MRDKEIVGLWEAYLQVHQPKEEVEQLDEEMTTSHPFRTGTPKPPAAPTLPPPASRKPTQPQQKPKIKPVGEEVENWVNSLIDEGYDLSEYTWEDMYEMYVNLDEGNRGENTTKMSNVSKLRRRQKNFAAGIVHPDEAGELEPERQSAHRSRRNVPTRGSGVREEYDTFDAILEHLIAEGYADTNESALVIMANMSEEWREEILDEAVRGSGRSIGDRITGNDIRGVTRKGKTVYKKPKWKDDVENKVDREYRGYALRRQGETENMNDRRDRERIKANRKSINRMNAARNIEHKQAEGDYENPIDLSNTTKGKSGYMEVPTDYRARNRRRKG